MVLFPIIIVRLHRFSKLRAKIAFFCCKKYKILYLCQNICKNNNEGNNVKGVAFYYRIGGFLWRTCNPIKVELLRSMTMR